MAPKLFLTGTTGYIGGDFLYLVSQAHPDWQLTCLVRNSDKGAKVAAAYPHVSLVYGDLDAADVIEEEAAKADVVYHFANCDHEPSARAIARGLARRPASSQPAFWIHTSGTLILGTETILTGAFGDLLDKVYDDWDHVQELTSFPDQAPHRHVDKIVLASYSDHVKTAIVCPPAIYGRGRGPDNTRSVQIYRAAEVFLQTKQAFHIGRGENVWHSVHVHDLSQLYLLLGEAAVHGGTPATWNDQGYYLAENGAFVWGQVLAKIAQTALQMGLLPRATVESYSPDQADRVLEHGRYLIGTNSRGRAIRGNKLLGWTPAQHSIEEEIATAVDSEARLLGLIQSHAATVQQG